MAGELGRENEGMEVKAPSQQQPRRSRFFVAQIMLRLLAVVFTVAAIPVMVTSNREVLVYGIDFMARYNYFSAFKFAIAVDTVVCAFSVGSLIFVCLGHIRTSEWKHVRIYFFLYLHDMVMVVLTVAACAAATAIGYIAYAGVEEIGWTAVCENAGQFCRQVLASVALSYVAFFAYLAIATTSAYKLMMTR